MRTAAAKKESRQAWQHGALTSFKEGGSFVSVKVLCCRGRGQTTKGGAKKTHTHTHAHTQNNKAKTVLTNENKSFLQLLCMVSKRLQREGTMKLQNRTEKMQHKGNER